MSAPAFRVVTPDATPEEVAAIMAALAVVEQERAAAAAAAAATTDPERLSAWVRASRLSARRAGLQRGHWRLSGRIGRRARA